MMWADITNTHAHEKEEGVKVFDGRGLLGRARRRWGIILRCNLQKYDCSVCGLNLS
jgi:hypothetical protein